MQSQSTKAFSTVKKSASDGSRAASSRSPASSAVATTKASPSEIAGRSSPALEPASPRSIEVPSAGIPLTSESALRRVPIKPAADHTFRVSFNRAFRAPSFINNHIQTTILNQVDLSRVAPIPQLSPFIFPISATGNADLKQETMTAYEIAGMTVQGARAWDT